MPDEQKTEKFGIEPFGTLAGVLSGEPIKIMPVGKFYRDERVLDITESDLREIEQNTTAGLPRFRIPINENHQPGGKIGTVKAVKFLPDGPDGKGLYAVDYEISEVGKQLLKDKRYDAVSPEMIWQKNGATYQDPQTGKKHSNILVGLAICERPFFSHEHVALFSAKPPDPAAPKRHNGYTKLRALMQAKFDELMALVKDDDGDGMPDMPADDKPEGMTAAIPDAGAAIQPAADAAMDTKGKEPMAENTPETFTVSADEFAALKAKADKVEQLEQQAKTAATQAEQFAARIAASEKRERLTALAHDFESFAAGDAPAATLAEKFYALELASPDLAEWFVSQFKLMDTQIKQGALFSQKSSQRVGGQAETFDGAVAKIHADKFNGDPAKYANAMDEAARLHPALYAEYQGTYSTRRKGE